MPSFRLGSEFWQFAIILGWFCVLQNQVNQWKMSKHTWISQHFISFMLKMCLLKSLLFPYGFYLSPKSCFHFSILFNVISKLYGHSCMNLTLRLSDFKFSGHILRHMRFFSDNASRMLGFKAVISAYGKSLDLCLPASASFHHDCFAFLVVDWPVINLLGAGFWLNTYKQNCSSDFRSQLNICQSKLLA